MRDDRDTDLRSRRHDHRCRDCRRRLRLLRRAMDDRKLIGLRLVCKARTR